MRGWDREVILDKRVYVSPQILSLYIFGTYALKTEGLRSLLYDLVWFCYTVEGVRFYLRGMVSCRAVLPSTVFLKPHQNKRHAMEKHPLQKYWYSFKYSMWWKIHNVAVSLEVSQWINSLLVNSSLVLLQFSPFGPSVCKKHLAKIAFIDMTSQMLGCMGCVTFTSRFFCLLHHEQNKKQKMCVFPNLEMHMSTTPFIVC